MMMDNWIILVTLCMAWFEGIYGAYLNDFDHDLHFECPSHQFINHIISDHNNDKEDRRFDLRCAAVEVDIEGLVETCDWTNWENSYDALLAFECDSNRYVNGMKSHHDNGREDRVWGFNCCEMHEIHLYDCKLTDWTNAWDGHQDYQVPASYVLKGVTSIHDNHREDRLYRYEICRVARNDGASLLGRRRVEGSSL